MDLMAYPEHYDKDDARVASELALAALGRSAACIDAYEASIRVLTDMQLTIARLLDVEPASSIAANCANLTRDIAATQDSSARWIFDV